MIARLNGGDRIDDSTRALLFGEMVKLAKPVVENYLSDLYHDANWLNQFIVPWPVGARSFFYGVRHDGTHIGTDRELITTYSERVYDIRVYKERWLWVADIREVSGE